MNIALATSSVFEPMLVLSSTAVLAGWRFGLSALSLAMYVGYLIAFTVVVVGIRFILAKRSKSNWDLSERKKRIVPLFILTGVFAVNVFGISLFGNRGLTLFHILWLIWAMGYALITLKMKISGHLSVAVMACGIVLRWYGWRVSPVLLLIPLLAWSRVTLNRHTPAEVWGGIVYAIGILFLAFRLF